MAIPRKSKGRKQKSDAFAGALDTYGIEALMQDGKAYKPEHQHFLGPKISQKHLN